MSVDPIASAIQSSTESSIDRVSESRLFQPIRLGTSELSHRIVLAPLTRFRADKAHVPTDLHVEYYAQRASVPGTHLITEATFVSANAGGLDNIPGIWNDAQISGWKKVSCLYCNASLSSEVDNVGDLRSLMLSTLESPRFIYNYGVLDVVASQTS